MSVWTCPRCDRSFGQKNRPHVCEAGMPVEIRLDEFPEGQRRAAEAILKIARKIPDLVIEAVGVGIFLKRERSIVELRPKTKWLDCSIVTTQTLDSRRIARTLKYGKGYVYYVHLTDKADVDPELKGWLTAALKPARTRS